MLLDENHLFLTLTSAIREICMPLTRVAITHFSYTKVYQDGRRVYLTTHPNLLQQYFQNQFYRIGHCEHQPHIYQPQKLFWSTLPNQCIIEQARNYNIGEGLFIIKPGKTFSEFFNFACDYKQVSVANFFLNQIELINIFMQDFILQAGTLIKQAEQINMVLPLLKQSFTVEALVPGTYSWQMLSPQQQRCADLLLQGHTIKRIAKAMYLSPRTIETYVTHMKHKLAAKNKSELILQLVKMR